MQKIPLWNTGGLFQGPLYFTSSNKVVFEKSMSVKYFVGVLAKKEKKQEKSCSEESL